MKSLNARLITVFVLGILAIPAGCDEAEIQDQNSEFVVADDDATEVEDLSPNVDPEESADGFDLSLDEDSEDASNPIKNFSALPSQPTALCEGYGPGSYCWAKCGNGVWYKLPSKPAYGGCTAMGAAACGGAWNLKGSCWGT